MKTDIDYQANGAMHFGTEHAKILIRIGVETEFSPKRLTIKSPTFSVGGVPKDAPEFWEALVFLLQRDLVVMAGDGFVEEKGFVGDGVIFSYVWDGNVENAR